MDPGNENYQPIIEHLPDALAYHRVIFDSRGHPIDSVLVDANPAFEEMIGLDRDRMLGRSISEIIPDIEGVFHDWASTTGAVSSTGQSIRLEGYLAPLGGWYEVIAYSFQPGYFATVFRDTTEKRRETEALEVLLSQLHDEMGGFSTTPDYQRMTDDLLALSGARFVAINTYAEGGRKTITRAISGVEWGIQKASEIMGFEVIGKAWDVIPERVESIREGGLLRFDTLYDSASGAVPRWAANALERLFDIGLVYVIELSCQRDSLGDFILFMPRGRTLDNPSIIELYANQSGIIILGHQAHRALRSKEEQFRTLAENAPDLITRLDRKCRRVYTNPAVARALGVSADRLIGKRNRDLNLEDSLTHVWEEAVAAVFRTGQPRSLESSRRVGGETRQYLIRLVPEFDDEGEVETVLSIARDITERKHAEQHIRWISFHDSLTGLYNRRFLDEEMRRLDTRRQLPLSVIMADLNGLKLVNDSFGHAAGDEMLQLVGEIIEESCRAEDIVGRWGGDEFLILLPQTDAGGVESVIARITELSNGAQTEHGIPISLTVGHATKRRFDQPLGDIVGRAEDAMYGLKIVESRSQKNALIDMLLETISQKSFETREHVTRMRRNALAIGEAMGLSSHELDRLGLAVDLHDVGEIVTPKKILQKPGPLSEEEWRTIRKHSEIGYRIARSTDSFAHVAETILHHHERWDGTGYPMGLAGEEIPLLARIITVVDAFDAMTQHRPYRSAISPCAALRELSDGAGSQFDAQLVEIFSEILRGSESGDFGEDSRN
ncbi:MAG: diguanylate cyclase [Bacillota bacterium]